LEVYERSGTGPGSYIFYNWTIKDSLGLTAVDGGTGNSWNLSGALINGTINWDNHEGIRDETLIIPANPNLKQNYPNPFNPMTIFN